MSVYRTIGPLVQVLRYNFDPRYLSFVYNILTGDGLAEASGSRSNSSLIDPDEMLQAVESDESL